MDSQCHGLPPCILVSMFPCFLASNANLCVYPSSSVFDPIPFIIRSRCGTGSSCHNGTRHCSVTLSLSATMEILPKCRNFQGCGQFAKTPRATLCASCFTAQAARSGTQSRGNVSPLINEGNKGTTKNRDRTIKAEKVSFLCSACQRMKCSLCKRAATKMQNQRHRKKNTTEAWTCGDCLTSAISREDLRKLQ